MSFFFFFFRSRNGIMFFFFFSSRRRHTRFDCDWSSDVCSSDLGQAGQWGSDLTQPDRDVLAGLLAELHLATPAVAALAPRRGLELHERATLETALAELDRPWSGGPLGEFARRELAAKADLVAGWLATFDSLAAHVTDSSPGVVVT